MKKELLLGLFMTFMFVGCVDNTDGIELIGNPQSYSEEEPEENKNDKKEETTISSHHQGDSCLPCHTSPAYEADGKDFLSGGTIYTALDATSASQLASSYTIRVVLKNTQSLDYKTKDDGGDANSYSGDSRLLSYDYTAQVVNSSGTIVNSSKRYSHNYTQLNCNSCHTQMGNNGAPGRIVSYEYTSVNEAPAKISFAKDVLPILETSCKHCHGSRGNFKVTTADETYKNIENFNGLNVVNPTDSLLLKKANGVNHGGGMIWKNTSKEYTSVHDWISDGGLNN